MIACEQRSDTLLFLRLWMCQISLICSRHPAIGDMDVSDGLKIMSLLVRKVSETSVSCGIFAIETSVWSL